MTFFTMTPDQVQAGLLAAPPLIAQTIQDLTVQHPNFLRDMLVMEKWPLGAGTEMQQLTFRGAMPQIERGFDKWRRIGNVQGCTPCEGPDCSYNWTLFGGHGLERRVIGLMARDFRTPSFCVNEIQTSLQYKEVFAKIVENVYRQVDFFKEYNIAQNALAEYSKKYVVDTNGPRANTQNPYVYRNVGAARLSVLNVNLMEFFYERMMRLPDCIPFGSTNGAPLFAMITSMQLLSHLYRDDNNLRQDIRFSSMANDLITQYAFTYTLRGMFLPATILYPRRFVLAPITGEPVEVLPFINGVPTEVGEYTDVNPDYEEVATHEEVLFMGLNPFKFFNLDSTESLGEGTSFGPEPSFLENWLWVNPPTQSDPFRRVGYFASHASLGISSQYSSGIFGVLVERPKVNTAAVYGAEPLPIPTPVVVDNSVPALSCPCPMIISIQEDPLILNTYFITFASIVIADSRPEQTIQFALENGAYITGLVLGASTDGKIVKVTFSGGLPGGVCARITGVYCDDSMGCTATVVSASDTRAEQTELVSLVLSNAIKANEHNDIITAYFGDGTTADLLVYSADLATNTWLVYYAPGFGPTDDPDGTGPTGLNAEMIEDRRGIIKVCVPVTTDATCFGCGAPIVSDCYYYENFQGPT